MTRPKRKEIMGRTIVIIDKETKTLWTKAAEKRKMSNSEYVRMLLKEHAPKDITLAIGGKSS